MNGDAAVVVPQLIFAAPLVRAERTTDTSSSWLLPSAGMTPSHPAAVASITAHASARQPRDAVCLRATNDERMRTSSPWFQHLAGRFLASSRDDLCFRTARGGRGDIVAVATRGR